VRSTSTGLILAVLVLAGCSTGTADSANFDALVRQAVREANPQMRWRAIWTLAKSSEKPRIVAALRPALDDGNAAVRWNAAIALSFFDDATVVPILNAAVTGPEPLRRWEAINALGRVWNGESVERLAVAVRSPSVRDRNEVVLTLGLIGPPAVDLLLTALSDESAEVRWRTAMALGRAGDIRALAALRRVAGEDSDERVREHAAKAFARLQK
jgi:HEAT repeat protein